VEASGDDRARTAAAMRAWALREADYEANMSRMETLYRELLGS